MKPTTPLRRALLLILLASLGLGAALFAGCGSEPPLDAVTPTVTRTPRPTITPTPSPTPTPPFTPTPVPPAAVFIPQGVPAPVADALHAVIAAHPDLLTLATSAEAADVWITYNPGEEALPSAEWVYAVVAPFPTVIDEVTWADITGTWQGAPTGPFGDRPLLMTQQTALALAAAMGDMAPGAPVEIVPADQIVQHAWDTRPAWAVVPFDQLEPRWKVLRMDGHSVLDKALDVAAYPLTVRIGATGAERGVTNLLARLGEWLMEQAPPAAGGAEVTAAVGLITNRDPSRMSVVLMTGVTALTRATAMRMDRHGVTYPAGDIRAWLVEPDITHISSEVSFATDCPPPGDYYTMTFCSNPLYIELIDDVDIDVIELTGNHLLDWGLEPMKLSLMMYDQRDLSYFGGGWNLAQAQSPTMLTHGVHTFGFIGCNPVGPSYVWATEERPGAAPCDYELVKDHVRQMREQGIIPIVTLQYWEFEHYEPTRKQREDFRALAEAGAAIVSGSQAHQPQAFDFYGGAFIHFGLGNLFFDQMWSLPTRQEFLDRHVFYNGRHISTEVLTAILEDYARPRPMTPEEREELLTTAFAASGW